MQIQGELALAATAVAVSRKMNPLQMGIHLVKTEGPRGLYSGLSAALLRQVFYSGPRFATYDVLKSKFGSTKVTSGQLPLWQTVPMAALAGAFGALVSTPCDVAMVRLQADSNRPVELRRNYKNVFDALTRITKEEGISTLWRGVTPTVARAMLVTVGHLAAYDSIKHSLIKTGSFKDNVITQLTASIIAAFLSSVLSEPIDVAKTRMMNMARTSSGVPLYSSTLDCLRKTVASEGIRGLYKGLTPTFARQCPYVVVTWLTAEQIKRHIF